MFEIFCHQVFKMSHTQLPHTWCVCVHIHGHTCTLSHSVMSDSLLPHGLQPARLPCPWGFPRQEYCSGLPCPPPGDLANPGIKPRSPALQVDSIPSEPPEKLKTGVGSLIPSPGDLPDPGIELGSPALQVDYIGAQVLGIK